MGTQNTDSCILKCVCVVAVRVIRFGCLCEVNARRLCFMFVYVPHSKYIPHNQCHYVKRKVLCWNDILLSKVCVDNSLTRFPPCFKHPLPVGEGQGEGTSERSLMKKHLLKLMRTHLDSQEFLRQHRTSDLAANDLALTDRGFASYQHMASCFRHRRQLLTRAPKSMYPDLQALARRSPEKSAQAAYQCRIIIGQRCTLSVCQRQWLFGASFWI